MLGAAIMAGASLISGLFGQSSAKKQARKEEAAIRASNAAASAAAADMNAQVRARADAAALVPVATERESRSFVDMEGFMSAAEEHGFNPLTFLRSGALSSFTHTEDWTCTTGERAMDAALSGQYMPQLAPVIASTRVPSVGEVFGTALQAGANEFVGGLNQQQQNKFQMDLLNAQLAGANRVGAYSGSRSFNAPTAKLTGGVSTFATPAMAGLGKSFIGPPISAMPRLTEAGPVLVNSPFFGPIVAPHGAKGGNVYNDAFGEAGDWIMGADMYVANYKNKVQPLTAYGSTGKSGPYLKALYDAGVYARSTTPIPNRSYSPIPGNKPRGSGTWFK